MEFKYASKSNEISKSQYFLVSWRDLPEQLLTGMRGYLVEHCTDIAEVMGLNTPY